MILKDVYYIPVADKTGQLTIEDGKNLILSLESAKPILEISGMTEAVERTALIHDETSLIFLSYQMYQDRISKDVFIYVFEDGLEYMRVLNIGRYIPRYSEFAKNVENYKIVERISVEDFESMNKDELENFLSFGNKKSSFYDVGNLLKTM